jgi:hypothetical protein
LVPGNVAKTSEASPYRKTPAPTHQAVIFQPLNLNEESKATRTMAKAMAVMIVQ